jgi:hypothetical protein
MNAESPAQFSSPSTDHIGAHHPARPSRRIAMKKPGAVTCAGPWRLLQFQLQLNCNFNFNFNFNRKLLLRLHCNIKRGSYASFPLTSLLLLPLLPRIQSYQLQE